MSCHLLHTTRLSTVVEVNPNSMGKRMPLTSSFNWHTGSRSLFSLWWLIRTFLSPLPLPSRRQSGPLGSRPSSAVLRNLSGVSWLSGHPAVFVWQFWAALDAGAIELKLLLMAGALRYDESVCWLYFTWNSRLLFQE